MDGKLLRLLENNDPEKRQILQELAFKNLGETVKLRKDCMNKLKSWYRKDCVPKQEIPEEIIENLFLRFLRASKFDDQKAIEMIERYLKMRSKKPEWFANLDQIQDEGLYHKFFKILIF